jgi:hypothetical protein
VFHVAFLKIFEGAAPTILAPLPPMVHGRAVPVPPKVVRRSTNKGLLGDLGAIGGPGRR